MPANSFVAHGYGWKAILPEQDEQLYARLNSFFENKKAVTDFPFIVFCNHIPSDKELLDIPDSEAFFSNTQQLNIWK